MTKNKIKLFIVDDDRIFRLGFCTIVGNFPDFQVIAQSNNVSETKQKLAQGIIPDVIIIELNIGRFSSVKESGWQLCKKLRRHYSDLPIFLLTGETEPKRLIAAKALGIQGYCNKGTEIDTIIDALRLVAAGKTYWQTLSFKHPPFWQATLSRLGQSGLQQIQAELYKINTQLENRDLSVMDRLFWSGRQRELLVSRWLVNRLASNRESLGTNNSNLPKALPSAGYVQSSSKPKLTLTVPLEDSLASQIFQHILSDISLGLVNRTGIPLEIDILKGAKQQELLYLVLEHLVKLLRQLSQPNNQDKFNTELEQIIASLWETIAVDFFFRNYDSSIPVDKEDIRQILQQDAIAVAENIFIHLYFLADLFTYLETEQPLLIDNVFYRAESPEAMARAEKLLQNLLTHVANGVMYAILNNFSDLEIFKYNLYHPDYRTSREIARFRNSLSWRYRQEKYWENPTNIFSSRYRLLVWQQRTIQTWFVYARRTEELEQLQGLPWLTTILLEIRDATAPLVRSVLALVGSGLIYILTQVIGRGIGLIGKGIIQGIGSTLQDSRYNNNDGEKKN
jgi:DNA-binding NarL/FixJ family response regulator